MDAVNELSTLDPKVWHEAYERVENYFRAHRITNRLLLHTLTARVIAAAAERHERQPHRPPATLAAEEAMRQMEEWIERRAGADPSESPARRHARGRAGVYLTGLPVRAPESFLDHRPLPGELEEELQATYLQAGPDLEFVNMGPRPIDLGPISGMADGTWRTFDKWPVLRGLVLWGLFLGLLVLAFVTVRF
jgi:hypothetical protein